MLVYRLTHPQEAHNAFPLSEVILQPLSCYPNSDLHIIALFRRYLLNRLNHLRWLPHRHTKIRNIPTNHTHRPNRA